MKRLVLALCAASTLVGCVSKAEYDAKLKEVKALRTSLEETQRELDDIKFGASRMYQQAKVQLEEEAYGVAIQTAKSLTNKHPSSPEAKQAFQIIAAAQTGIKKQEEAKRQAEEKVRREAEAKKRAEQQRLANALSNMRKKHDEIKGITWYYDKTSPKYYSERSNLELYIGKERNSNPWLRFLVQYTSDDWLFIERFIINADGRNFEIVPEKFGGVERDNGSGDIWEWYDVTAGERELEIAKAIAESKKAVIRYEGRQYYKDRVVSSKEKQAIKNVLSAYEVLSRD